jgi:hypothetical protein
MNFNRTAGSTHHHESEARLLPSVKSVDNPTDAFRVKSVDRPPAPFSLNPWITTLAVAFALALYPHMGGYPGRHPRSQWVRIEESLV